MKKGSWWACGTKGTRFGLKEKELRLESEPEGGLGGVDGLPLLLLLLLLRRLAPRSEFESCSSSAAEDCSIYNTIWVSTRRVTTVERRGTVRALRHLRQTSQAW